MIAQVHDEIIVIADDDVADEAEIVTKKSDGRSPGPRDMASPILGPVPLGRVSSDREIPGQKRRDNVRRHDEGMSVIRASSRSTVVLPFAAMDTAVRAPRSSSVVALADEHAAAFIDCMGQARTAAELQAALSGSFIAFLAEAARVIVGWLKTPPPGTSASWRSSGQRSSLSSSASPYPNISSPYLAISRTTPQRSLEGPEATRPHRSPGPTRDVDRDARPPAARPGPRSW